MMETFEFFFILMCYGTMIIHWSALLLLYLNHDLSKIEVSTRGDFLAVVTLGVIPVVNLLVLLWAYDASTALSQWLTKELK